MARIQATAGIRSPVKPAYDNRRADSDAGSQADDDRRVKDVSAKLRAAVRRGKVRRLLLLLPGSRATAQCK